MEPLDERDVEARLHAALGDGLSGHVDVISLVNGARAGAVRVRRRRRVAAGAALLVVLAVPTGAVMSGQQQHDDSGLRVAAPLPDAPSASLSPTPSVTASASRTEVPPAPPAPEVDPSTLEPDENAVEIPLAVLPTEADFPVSMVRLDDATTYRLNPVVMGLQCNLDRKGTDPIAGASDVWVEDSSIDQLIVSTIVTAYSRGQGAKAFTEARTETGSCTWLSPAETSDFSSEAGHPAFTRVESGVDGASQTVVGVGDLLVGVEVRGVRGADEFSAQEISREVAEIVAGRLMAARVPGSAG